VTVAAKTGQLPAPTSRHGGAVPAPLPSGGTKWRGNFPEEFNLQTCFVSYANLLMIFSRTAYYSLTYLFFVWISSCVGLNCVRSLDKGMDTSFQSFLWKSLKNCFLKQKYSHLYSIWLASHFIKNVRKSFKIPRRRYVESILNRRVVGC